MRLEQTWRIYVCICAMQQQLPSTSLNRTSSLVKSRLYANILLHAIVSVIGLTGCQQNFINNRSMLEWFRLETWTDLLSESAQIHSNNVRLLVFQPFSSWMLCDAYTHVFKKKEKISPHFYLMCAGVTKTHVRAVPWRTAHRITPKGNAAPFVTITAVEMKRESSAHMYMLPYTHLLTIQ